MTRVYWQFRDGRLVLLKRPEQGPDVQIAWDYQLGAFVQYLNHNRPFS